MKQLEKELKQIDKIFRVIKLVFNSIVIVSLLALVIYTYLTQSYLFTMLVIVGVILICLNIAVLSKH